MTYPFYGFWMGAVDLSSVVSSNTDNFRKLTVFFFLPFRVTNHTFIFSPLILISIFRQSCMFGLFQEVTMIIAGEGLTKLHKIIVVVMVPKWQKIWSNGCVFWRNKIYCFCWRQQKYNLKILQHIDWIKITSLHFVLQV